MGFANQQHDRLLALWDRMLAHPFLLETRDGILDDATFATWMQQDFLFVEAAIPFVASLVAKAPPEARKLLTGALPALERELELFRERAASVGVELEGARPAFVNHAYIQFLLATGWRCSFAEGLAVLYTAEKAYFDSWSVVRAGLDPRSPWYPFVDNWTSEAFASWVEALRELLDHEAEAAGAGERERMAQLFELTVRYETAFWEMAWTGGGWPGETIG
jgi:thiaminase